MRQLTSLDAQFLAMESPRTYGHVSGLAVHDPSTAPGGTLTAQDMCRLVGERIHLLPPFRWKLVEVPFGLDHPYWIEDADFDLLPRPRDGGAAARRAPSALRARRTDLRRPLDDEIEDVVCGKPADRRPRTRRREPVA